MAKIARVYDGSAWVDLASSISDLTAYSTKIPTYNAQTGTTYTFVLSDTGSTVTASNASAQTYTIPPQADVVWLANSTIRVTNLGAGVVTFAGGVGVTVTNTAQTLAQYQSAQLIRTASNAWTVAPFTSGASLLSDSAISGTTGSPTTGTYTDGGIDYKTYSFTGTGSITFTKAGMIDILVVGAGGGVRDEQHGGGAGGMISQTNYYVTAASQTVTIGAGGGSSRGGDSVFDKLYGVGGGTGGYTYSRLGNVGGSGGGTGYPTFTGLNVPGQGNAPGSNAGGGAGSAGSGGTGGTGLANSITGSSVTYAAGGNQFGGSGTANTGNGSGGTTPGNAGGSGIVIVRVLQ